MSSTESERADEESEVPPVGSGARPVVKPPPPPKVPQIEGYTDQFEEDTRIVLSDFSSPTIQLDSEEIPEETERNTTDPPPPRVSDRPPAPLPAICEFGRFQLLGRLAFGGMAEIFLAREPIATGGSRHVVIKRILPHVADNEQFTKMFVDEARLAMQLNHPNICHIYEFGKETGHFFIAMEWLNGVPLGKLIRRARHSGGVPPEIAVKVISNVASALHYAHRARDSQGRLLELVHRDVSPQNVMVTFDGIVKLLDFGIAKASSQVTKTQAGIIKGKFAYMAPEQCLGKDLDRRADIFSLGICLFEALSGRPLYHRKIEYETMQAVIESPVPSLRDVNPDIPEDLDQIVMKALQKAPDDRYQSAGEMQTALEEWLLTSGHAVTSARITDLMEECFWEEIQRGPLVDSTPFGKSLNAALPSESVDGLSGETTPSALAMTPSAPRRPLLIAAAVVTLAGALGLTAGLLSGGDEPEVAVVEADETVEAVEAAQAAPEPAPAEAVPLATPTPDEAAASELEVRSTPPGARVLIDGEEAEGLTPMALDIPPGSHELRVELQGFQPFETSVEVTSEEPTLVEASLSRSRPTKARPRGRGRLSINTRPWSKVYLGNRLLGTTPIETNVPAGPVRLRLVDRDGETHRRTVRVEAGGSENVFYDLNR